MPHKQPGPSTPLSLARIEPKPKRILEVDGFEPEIDLTKAQVLDLIQIRNRITNGLDLEEFYRAGIDSNPHPLLTDHEVMHLHLGGKGSDALLYLVQYPNHVVFVTIDTHVHVNDVPPGKKLPVLKIKAIEQLIAKAHAKITEEAAAQSARIAASIKKFKASRKPPPPASDV